ERRKVAQQARQRPHPESVRFADAYLEGCFGWEFKGAETQLPGAFDQLLRYQVYLRTPPLLVVSSFQLIRVQTNFRDKETVVHDIPIAELGDPEQLRKLRNIFFDPGAFEPERTVDDVTRETARLFGRIAEDMEQRGAGGERLARYLNQIVFCLYAEDAGLLRDNLFTEIVRRQFRNPDMFNSAVRNLFAQMAGGGLFGADEIARFNGDLFNESDTVELSEVSLQRLVEAVEKNWRDIEPSIFGTLFEGVMDATKRSRLGAHYTGADDILLVIEPVIMKPLRREWNAARQQIDDLIADGNIDQARAALDAFRERLASVTVLDPACGSGNFLYIALRSLLDLEKQVMDYGAEQGWHGMIPQVNPSQMAGIELDHYAAELARTALWIGYIQWHELNGFRYERNPILTPLDTIRRMDAILDYDAHGNPVEPDWPDAEFIVGNPPFLGRGYMRGELGDVYTNDLYSTYGNRLPNASDLCCYWFEKARAFIERGKVKRAGLLGTQGIRGGHNRVAMQRIKDSGDIFAAHSDREWVLDGAMVHISIVCFDDGSEKGRKLDGLTVNRINSNLTSGIDTTVAKRLKENRNIAFEGQSPKARFDIPPDDAGLMLAQPLNVNGRPNSDVVLPVLNGRDITERNRGMYTVNFGLMSFDEACQYEMPFEHVKLHVYPERQKKSQAPFRKRWWQYATPRPVMRSFLKGLERYIATPIVSKHRIFVWVKAGVVCTNLIDVFVRNDDYTFGVLHSRLHELWARAMGTQLREAESGFRYTPTTCFQTFPFPRPTDEQREAIAEAARELNRLREGWLNPVDADGNLVMFGVDLRRRTLTNLYNEYESHTWLVNAHDRLNAAVAAAYGWDADISDDAVLEGLLALNLERAEGETEE
ncbi:MAG: class I SAM-dependent DNA methyltransferase, partial [Chloroflexi bacterium]|nr:class I SAM-dependent DNA methyltransferase [Chloroflexota bacterium]